MAPLPADGALRRLVSRLAEQDGADVQAILDRLEPAHRLRVHALLKIYLGTANGGVYSASAISTWIEDRVSGTSDKNRTRSWTMTPMALASLARARETLGPSIARSPRTEPVSWLERQLRKGRPT